MENLGFKMTGGNHDWNPFHYAARSGHLEVCKYFLENVENKEPTTAGSRDTPHSVYIQI